MTPTSSNGLEAKETMRSFLFCDMASVMASMAVSPKPFAPKSTHDAVSLNAMPSAMIFAPSSPSLRPFKSTVWNRLNSSTQSLHKRLNSLLIGCTLCGCFGFTFSFSFVFSEEVDVDAPPPSSPSSPSMVVNMRNPGGKLEAPTGAFSPVPSTPPDFAALFNEA